MRISDWSSDVCSSDLGEGHAGDAGLGGGVGDLPDLALEGGDAGGVDDHAALVVIGLVLRHVGRGEAAPVEGGDQVEVDDLAEGVERVRPVLAERARGDAAAGRVHQDVQVGTGVGEGKVWGGRVDAGG